MHIVVNGAKLDVFDGFPYLITHVVPGFYHAIPLPGDVPPDKLIGLARWQVTANDLGSCLVLAIDSCLYIAPDGRELWSRRPPAGGTVVGGKLKAACQFPPTPELACRCQQLEEYQERFRRKGYLFGDLTKGGRRATPIEVLFLNGTQRNGVPNGLVQCPTCGEWRGECLDPSPTFAGMIMPVHCRCENQNHCAGCGRLLHERRLNANYFDTSDGTIWHVPAFCGFSHRCEEVTK